MDKTVQCPQCKNTLSVSGNPGEIVKVTCPSCGNNGKVTFKALETEKNSAIQVFGLRKEYSALVAVNNITFAV